MASCLICNSGILRTFVRNEFTGDRIGPRGSVFSCLVEHASEKDGKKTKWTATHSNGQWVENLKS